MERLDMLRAHCEMWTGPIAAVVYAPLLGSNLVSLDMPHLNGTTVADQSAHLAAVHAELEAAGPCRLDLDLTSEAVPSYWLSGHYPFNALRNRALLLVRTQVILLLDVDFLPSAALSRNLTQPGAYAALAEQLEQRIAVVLPAFEPTESGEAGTVVARQAVSGGKQAVVQGYEAGMLKPFQVDRYPKGHSPTGYERWVVAVKPYRIRYREGYEPYLLLARKYVPWYDERFRGYGKDKIVQISHLATWISFVVHPWAFVVHQPHGQSRAYKVTKKTGQWNELFRLYAEVQGLVAKGEYTPVSAYSCASSQRAPGLQAPQNRRKRPAFGRPGKLASEHERV
ncbi:hypothetical protein WJX72_006601 [[Myrmecia] bisecta]|uniref:Uncharacterized protein n=1 Tax=[Myrmecia] bisecta TaxID=41462 RepID=A0AAW1P5Q3_9CHLO